MVTTIATILGILCIWLITSTSQLYLSNKRKRKLFLPKEHYSPSQNKNSNLPLSRIVFLIENAIFIVLYLLNYTDPNLQNLRNHTFYKI